MTKFIELLQNGKVIISTLLLLLSALGASTYEVVDSHDEIDALKEKYVIEVHPVVVEPVEHKEYNHDKMIKQIKTLQSEVNRLRERH